ncbi:dihydrolipoamide acetyltransferase family protein [Haloechinothrix halophila]|uniref:dihydrolipoamide acetyltransferase family protein n=1 Tax=Haloechinothrix halophila TaxID=1069073 RepID=UPI00040BEF3B|nr:dihydrolipoamide acetyltransferase family protein [Haloechinothrix halophila]
MSNPQDFRLPDVGEGLTEADISRWSVQPGDIVEINQTLVEVETAKAMVELPSPFAGTVVTLHAAEGDTVEVGKPLITIDSAPDASPGSQQELNGDAAPAVEDDAEQAELLVGYGPRPAARTSELSLAGPPSRDVADAADSTPSAAPTTSGTTRPAAKPPVRKLAKELGVDLTTISPTGPHGTVTRDDVRRATTAAETRPVTEPEHAAERRIPIKGIRKHTAEAMVSSAFTAPHVTEFVMVDITATMRLRTAISARREFREVRVTPLVFVARALLLALRNTPEANATWDEQAREIVVKHYVNLGIATATDRGLMVPNIKNAERLSLRDLAESITGLAATARAGSSTLEDMSHGTITVSNIGVFGVDSGTPILNPGEAAILACGAVRRMPWVVSDGESERIEPRWVTQLSLSFDHRIIDGQQGSQLLADTAALLEDPGLAFL